MGRTLTPPYLNQYFSNIYPVFFKYFPIFWILGFILGPDFPILTEIKNSFWSAKYTISDRNPPMRIAESR
jgi:hypothetical protein